MDRRQYLGALGTVPITAAIAGCTGSEEENGNGNGNGNGDTGNGDGNGNGDAGNGDSDGNGDSSGNGDGNGNGNGNGDSGNGNGNGDSAENVDAVVGSLVEGDNIHLVVEGIETTTQIGEFQEADDGNEFVIVTMAMKNVSDGFVNVSNLLQTSLRDDEDYSYDQAVAVTENPSFNGGQFAPGEIERGTIVFEVPKDASGRSLQFDFDVSIFGGVDRAVIDLESETDVHTLEQDLEIDVNDVGAGVSYGDVTVTVNEVRSTDSLGDYTQAEEGNEYAIVDISVENNTGEEQRVSTMLQMMIKDGAGWSYQEDLMATGELDRPFDESSALTDGETRRGELVYQVEKDLSPLYWVFEFTLWNDGDKTFWQLR